MLPLNYLTLSNRINALSYAGFTNPNLHLQLEASFFEYPQKATRWLPILRRQRLSVYLLSSEQLFDLFYLTQEKVYRELYHLCALAQDISSQQGFSPSILLTYSGPLTLKTDFPMIYELLLKRLQNLCSLFPSLHFLIENKSPLTTNGFSAGGYQLELKQWSLELEKDLNQVALFGMSLNTTCWQDGLDYLAAGHLDLHSLKTVVQAWDPELIRYDGDSAETLDLIQQSQIPFSLLFKDTDEYEQKHYKKILKKLEQLAQKAHPC